MTEQLDQDEIQRIAMEEISRGWDKAELLYAETVMLGDKEAIAFAAYESPNMFFVNSFEFGQSLHIRKDEGGLILELICEKLKSDAEKCVWEINILSSDGHKRTVNFKNDLSSNGFKTEFTEMLQRLSSLGEIRIEWEGPVSEDIKMSVNEKISK